MQVSLVITVLNETKTLRCLLMSIEKFSTLPQEVIFVDGGSIDGTFELLNTWKKKVSQKSSFSNLKIKIFQKVGNISVGRNEGILLASCDWIALTDAGCTPDHDWIYHLKNAVKDNLKSSLKVEKKSELLPIVAGYYYGKPKSSFEKAVVPFVLVSPDQLDPKSFLPATRSMMIHKNTWFKLGKFREDLKVSEDYHFALKAVDNHVPILFTKQAKVGWRPRSSIFSFVKMVYLHAYYDQLAGIRRKKVNYIFYRYFLGAGLVLILSIFLRPDQMWLFMFIGFLSYSLWSLIKHKKHWPSSGGCYLLLLQWSSDLAVMAGTVMSLLRVKFR
jgi:glycosyltransferase involved in cell wall biosynthesis